MVITCAKADSTDLSSDEDNKINVEIYSKAIGDGTITFVSDPEKQKNTYDISATQKLETIKLLAVDTIDSRDIASSILYQKLAGATYTASPQEWTQFLDSVIKGLRGNGFKELTFTLLGVNEKSYTGTNIHKEYVFTGIRRGNEQIIYNLALFSEDRTKMYILSVGGNEFVKEDVYKEFKRLVSSFKL
jgi:hypothetical protein